MSAKEIKALIEIGMAISYSGDELKQFITDERRRLDKEKERETFLKTKGKLSLKEMTKASNDYYEAHGYPNGNQDKKPNGNGTKPHTHGKPNDGSPYCSPNAPLRCENCGLRNHCTSECKKFRDDQEYQQHRRFPM